MTTPIISSPKIAMVVANPGSNDSRVVRAAEAAANAGYNVHVVGILRKGFQSKETINGVTYHRVSTGTGRLGKYIEASPYWLKTFAANILLRRDKNSPKDNTKTEENDTKERANNTQNIQVRPLVPGPGIAEFSFSRVHDFFPMLSASIRHRWRKYFYVPIVYPISIPRSKTRSKNSNQEQINTPVNKKRQSNLLVNIVRAIKNEIKRAKQTRNMDSKRYRRRVLNGHRVMHGRYFSAFLPTLFALNADIYYAHELPTLSVCSYVSERTNAKLIYDSHELEPHRNANWTREVREFWTLKERELIGKADAVITVSYSLADALMKIYGLKHVTVIRNTSPLQFTRSSYDIRSSIGLGQETPLIVFVGLLSFNRGLDLLAEALIKLPEFHLATVGPVNERILQETIDQFESLGVRDRLHVHPKVPYLELINFLSTADVSVIPFKNTCLSHFCLLPNKLFESVFAGLPVVASNFPDLALFIDENEAGYVCNPEDTDELADTIKLAYQNKNTLMPLDKVNEIRQKHCYERESEKLLLVFDRLGFPKP